jgi:hypothetical protein
MAFVCYMWLIGNVFMGNSLLRLLPKPIYVANHGALWTTERLTTRSYMWLCPCCTRVLPIRKRLNVSLSASGRHFSCVRWDGSSPTERAFATRQCFSNSNVGNAVHVSETANFVMMQCVTVWRSMKHGSVTICKDLTLLHGQPVN